MKKLFNILKNLIILISKVIAVTAVVIAALYAYYKLMDIVFSNFLPQMSVWVLANFIIFAGILYFVIFRMVNAPEQINKMQKDIAETIETSETAKMESEEKLNNIEESLTHIGEEIDAILSSSNENAKLIGKKILDDAQSTVLVIQENSEKTIENNRELLKNELLKRASLASIEVAKSYILDELEKNPELHDRMIDESIEKIEGTELK